MGKTTLCASIMGLMPSFKGSARGSISFLGHELLGQPPYKIAKLGVGYIPQGRRLFPSLTVDEHLRMLAPRGGDGWSAKKVYDLFPRLAERKRNGGAELSGGEQQMLAIGRALLTNPKLLIMDEPSEGLAPMVIENLIVTFRTLEEGGLRILLIEQNLAVATSLAERQLIMVGGEVALEATAAQLAGDPEMQRRYLGVEPLARER
jgi:branched-chain amino acid transport system ATP-binding protein